MFREKIQNEFKDWVDEENRGITDQAKRDDIKALCDMIRYAEGNADRADQLVILWYMDNDSLWEHVPKLGPTGYVEWSFAKAEDEKKLVAECISPDVVDEVVRQMWSVLVMRRKGIIADGESALGDGIS